MHSDYDPLEVLESLTVGVEMLKQNDSQLSMAVNDMLEHNRHLNTIIAHQTNEIHELYRQVKQLTTRLNVLVMMVNNELSDK